MRHLTAAIVFATGIATGIPACSVPDKQLVPIDAAPDAPQTPQGPFACQNQRPPSTAPAQINITGTVAADFNPSGIPGPVPDAMIAVFLPGDLTTQIASARSGPDGTFTIHLPTGGYSHPIVVTVTANPYLPTYYYPAVAVFADLVDLRLEMFTATSAKDFMGLMGVDSLNLSLGAFAISVYDCNGNHLAKATVSTSPTANMVPAVHYLIDAPDPRPSKTATSTDGIFGLALAVNVPIDNTNIQATIPLPDNPSTILNLRSQIVPGISNALIQVDIQP
jgi:hypothetical protein